MRRAAFPLLGALLSAVFFLPIVRAEDGVVVDHTMDFFVVVTVPTLFTAETDLCPGTDDYWCSRPPFQDSVLWVYDDQGAILAVNDDDPRRRGQSWNSYIELELQPGVYRLRAGKFGPCDESGCLHPEAPFDEGCEYHLTANLPIVLDPNPPSASIAPIPSVLPEPSEEPTIEPSPTESPTATPTESPTPEPSPSPEPTPTPSPSVEPSPTPTPEPTPSATATPRPTPAPTVAPPPSPTEPPPSPTEPPPSPTEAPPTPTEAPPTPTEPPPPTNPVEAVSQAVDAVAKSVGVAVTKLTHLGQDLTPTQKAKARPVAVALVISQIASAAAAAATNIRKAK